MALLISGTKPLIIPRARSIWNSVGMQSATESFTYPAEVRT